MLQIFFDIINLNFKDLPKQNSIVIKKITWDNFGFRTKFEENVSKICDIVNKKLNTLHRFASHVNLNKRKMVLRAFIKSQFSYCPLIWMLYSRPFNNQINLLHEKALRIYLFIYLFIYLLIYLFIYLFIKLMNLQTVLCLSFSRVFLGDRS